MMLACLGQETLTLDATETAAACLMESTAFYMEPGSPVTMLWLELVFASVVTLL